MSDDFAYDVFISYSHDDAGWVRGELLPRLEREKIKVCIDFRDFEPGAPSVLEMERAVKESRRTLLVLTPAYLDSEWTEFEGILLQTLDPANRKRRLIPLLKERCELPLRINAFTHVDFTEVGDVPWSRLITTLKPPAPQRKKKSRPTRDDWLLVHPYPMPPNFTGRVAERQMLSGWLEGNGPPLFVLRALGGFGKSALVWHWLLNDVKPGRWPRVLWWSFYETQATFDAFLSETLAYLGVDPKQLGPREQVKALLVALRYPGALLVLDGFERELRAFAGMGAAYQGDEEAAAPGEDDRDCVSPLTENFLRSIASLPGVRARVLLTTRLRPRILETRTGERAGEYDAASELFRGQLLNALYYQFGAYDLCIELLRALFPDGEDRPPRLGGEYDQAVTLNSLANSYSLSGQPRRAAALFELSSEIMVRLGDKSSLAISLGNLACMAQRVIGDFKSAEANLRQRIALTREIGSKFSEAIGHQELGHLLAYLGRWEEADTELEIARKFFEQMTDFQGQGIVCTYQALRHHLLLRVKALNKDSRPQALAAAQRALELSEETAQARYPVERDYVRAYWLLGASHREADNLTAADRHLSEALVRCRRINSVDAEADILLDLARLRFATGDRLEARRLAEEALAITERSGYVLRGADVHLLFARLEMEEGKEAEARRHAAEARRLATCDGPPDYTYRVAYDEAGALLERLGGESP